MEMEAIPNVPKDQERDGFLIRLYDDHIKLMYYIVRGLSQDLAQQEEIIQESMARLIAMEQRLREMSPAERAAYVAATVRNTAISELRRRQVQSRKEIPFELYGEETPQIPMELEELWMMEERRQRLRSALTRMDEEERFLLEARYFLGYTDQEIADQLGCQSNSVRMKLTRARRQLQRMMLCEDGEKNDDGTTAAQTGL